MNCEEFDHFLDPYLDRELDPAQLIQLEQHLSDCPVCRSLVQECLDFRSFFRSNAPVYTAPPRLRTSVLATVRRERLKSELAILRRSWIYVAVVLFFGLAALTIFLPDNTKELSGQAVALFTQSLTADHLVEISWEGAPISSRIVRWQHLSTSTAIALLLSFVGRLIMGCSRRAVISSKDAMSTPGATRPATTSWFRS